MASAARCTTKRVLPISQSTLHFARIQAAVKIQTVQMVIAKTIFVLRKKVAITPKEFLLMIRSTKLPIDAHLPLVKSMSNA